MEEEILKVLKDIRDMQSQRIQAERISHLDILDTADASFLLGYEKSYILKLVAKNFIPYYRSANGKIYFKKEELKEWATMISCPSDVQLQAEASEHILKSNR